MGGESRVLGACPLDCPDTCSWIVTVKDGRAVRLGAIPSTRSRAASCATRSTTTSRTPGRPTVCCIRCAGSARRAAASSSASRGTRRSTRSPGGSATSSRARRRGDLAVHRLRQHGPPPGRLRRRAPAVERRSGTSRHVMTICTIAGGFGTGYTLGDNRVGMDPETLRFSKLIVLWGSNTLTDAIRTCGGRSSRPARRGAQLVVIDPDPDPDRRRPSDWHLAPMPGTDAALALGLLHVVLAEGARTATSSRAHARLGGVSRSASSSSRRRASRDHRASDRVDRRARPAAGRHPSDRDPHRHRPPASRRRRHGGADHHLHPRRHRRLAPSRRRRPLRHPRLLRRELAGAVARRPAAAAGRARCSMTRLGEGLLEVDDPPVKALFIYASNPLASVPHQTKVRRGLARDDLFTVVVEHFLTDTARYADIVLPATMQTEHARSADRLRASLPRLERAGGAAAGRVPVRRRRSSGASPGAWASTQPPLYDSDEEMARQVLDSGHPSLAGITLEALKARGWMRLNYPEPFVPFADRLPDAVRQARVRLRADGAGRARSASPATRPPTRRRSADTALAREYPLALVTPADHYFLNSIFANVPRQQRRSGAADAADPSRRRGAAGHRDRRRGARRQRPRRVLRRGRGQRSRAAAAWSPAPRGGGRALRDGGRHRQRHRRRARLRHGRRRGVPRQPRPGRATSRPTACLAAPSASRSGLSWRCRRS